MKKPNNVCWRPHADGKNTQLEAFQDHVAGYYSQVSDYASLHRFSIENIEQFWSLWWDYAHIKGHKGQKIFTPARDGGVFGARFFEDARLNYTQNVLSGFSNSEQTAIISWDENGTRRELSISELQDCVHVLIAELIELGIKSGDCVAAVAPNIPEMVIGLLACAAIGAIWTSCSPDFGRSGIIDRFGQTKPKVLIAGDGYYYKGKTYLAQQLICDISKQLPSLLRVYVIPIIEPELDLDNFGRLAHKFPWPDSKNITKFDYPQLPFNHPLYVLYSSGTTGMPKCIVHGAGNMLLQHKKEHQLHGNLKPADKLFFFSTCGWMMWNWLVTALASGVTIVLFDGNPTGVAGRTANDLLWQMAEREQLQFFGTSAPYIEAMASLGIHPIDTYDLQNLNTIGSTGAPLTAESFDFVYQYIKHDVHLTSISGGTDIASCFVLGAPNLPVYRGQIQVAGLGQAIEVFNEAGQSLEQGKGELVCTKPFPAMPVSFFNDTNNQRYQETYFMRFAKVWHHGDFIERTPEGGYIIHGRSDSTLNRHGIRIGTAEIYRVMQQLPYVQDSIIVTAGSNDNLVLFVVTDDLSPERIKDIQQTIRNELTPRHLPNQIIKAPDIPRTLNGKLAEIAVRDTLAGGEVKNKDALINPSVLNFFAQIKID